MRKKPVDCKCDMCPNDDNVERFYRDSSTSAVDVDLCPDCQKEFRQFLNAEHDKAQNGGEIKAFVNFDANKNKIQHLESQIVTLDRKLTALEATWFKFKKLIDNF